MHGLHIYYFEYMYMNENKFDPWAITKIKISIQKTL